MKVLILTLYTPPAIFVAARRFEGWVRYLPEYGIEPLVLTRAYAPEQQLEIDPFQSQFAGSTQPAQAVRDGRYVYLPFPERPALRRLHAHPLGGGLSSLVHGGWLHRAKAWLKGLPAEDRPDLVIASFGPAIVLRLGRWCSEYFGVPWIADLRDYFVYPQRNLQVVRRWFQRRALASCCAVTTVTEGIANDVAAQLEPLRKPVEVIYNGAEPKKIDSVARDHPAVDQYETLAKDCDAVWLYTGTFYPTAGRPFSVQEKEFFFEGISRANRAGRRIRVILLGNHSPDDFRIWPFIHCLGTVPYETSRYLQSHADMLFFPTLRNESAFSGKLFEFAVSGTPVVVGPSPTNDLQTLCHEGEIPVVKTPAELDEFLAEPWTRRESIPDIVTKAYWGRRLAEFLKSMVKSRSFDRRAWRAGPGLLTSP